ncbi:DUF4082 domain-containing protein [Sphaerisporangium sp. NPDC049003]|uniref:DUF4082 domain-containing protein n=1 Tax=Sphaerisporangium sp. NPDC049003 TaxID=3364517 RepID=UPI003712E98D
MDHPPRPVRQSARLPKRRLLTRVIVTGLVTALALSSTSTAEATEGRNLLVLRQAPTPPKPEQVTERPDMTSAGLAARLQNSRVEVTSERTEESTSWINPDGTVTTEINSGPIRVKRGDGWTPVDITLVQDGNRLVPKAAVADIDFSADGSGAFASIADDTTVKVNGKRKGKTRRFGLKWAGQLGKPEVSGSTMTWRDVVPGADLVVQAQVRGFVHFMVFRERPTGPVEIKLPIELSGMTFGKRADHGLQLADDSSGKVIAAAPAPQMWDAAAEQSPDQGKRAEVASEIVNGPDGPTFVLKPDTGFMSDPAVQYPVTVDPWMNLTLQTDTFVSTDYPSSQTSGTWLHAGKFGSGAKTARTYLQFGLNGMTRKHILNADLTLSNYKSNACGSSVGSGMQVRRVTSAWQPSTLTLAAQPSTTATDAVTNTKAYGDPDCAESTMLFSIESMLQAWSDGTPNYGMQIRAVNESDITNWRMFRSSENTSGMPGPMITVQWNSYPTVPSALSITPSAGGTNGGTYVTSLTPTLAGLVGDGEWDTEEIDFEVLRDPAYPAEGTGTVWSGAVTGLQQGELGKIQVPAGKLADGKHYQWRARAFDGTDYSRSWSALKSFTVDVTDPVAPTVSVASYSANVWSAKQTQPVTATFTTSSADGSGYYWGLDDPSAPNLAADNGGGGKPLTVGIDPKQGWHTLYVKTRDMALRTSTVTAYSFGAGVGQVTKPLDEDRTQAAIALAAIAAPDRTGVRYEYKADVKTDAIWSPIPTTDVTVPGSPTPIAAWPVTRTDTSQPFAELYWDVAHTMRSAGRGDGPVALRACFTSGTADNCSDPLNFTLERTAFGASYATASLGPGSAALLTGDYSVSATDADAFGLSVSRGHTTLAPATVTGAGGVFGPGWTASFPTGSSTVAGSQFEDHTDKGYVLFTGPDGSQLTYTKQADGTYQGVSDATDGSTVVKDSPTQFTHTDAAGVKTTFKAAAVAPTAPAHLFAATAAPAVAAVNEPDPLEIGVKFTADQPGLITGVRFYKGTGNTGAHIGNLWTTSGQNLATGTFSGETASGWQTLTFAAPVQVSPGTTYVASYFAPAGHYSFTDNFFSTATDSPPLHAPATADVYGGNGVYGYGAASTFPSGSYHGGNYWVDVEFVPNQGAPDPALLTVSTTSLFGVAATPGTAASTDPDPVELGVKFTADQPGFITGIRFYKGQGNTGTHIGNLWTASGQKIATGTFTEEATSGWQTLTFTAPIRVTSGTTYIASYFAPAGHYSFDGNYFATAKDSPPLHAPATSAVYGGNGVFSYGTASQFPTSSYGGGNYWVDVNFASDLTRWVVSSVREPGQENTTTYMLDGQGRVTRMLAPVPAGVDCSASLVAGCKTLDITYASATTATGIASGWGDYAGLVKSISYAAYDPATSAMKSTIVTTYGYDSTGHLRTVTDPRVALTTTYYYTGEGRLSQVTPSGLAPWRMEYDTTGRIAHVTRTSPQGELTQAIAYNLPIGGTGAPIDLTSTQTTKWAQATDLPRVGAAVFPPSKVPARAGDGTYTPSSGDFPYGRLTYLDVNGRSVNTAVYGAGAWQVSATRYDDYGNTVWEIGPGNRAQALAPTADTDPYAAGRTSSAERADLLATITTYDDYGNVVTTDGPTHRVALASRTVVSGRQHTAYTYDEGMPSNNIALGLVTTTKTSPRVADGTAGLTAADTRTLKTGYAPIVSGDPSGWDLAQPTSQTTLVPGGTDIVQRVRYDDAGRQIERWMPSSAGSDAGTTITTYYTFGANSVAACGNKPEWAGLVCRTAPAAQPTGQSLPVTTTRYGYFGGTTTVTEDTGSVVRTSTSTYDGAGRVTTTSLNVTTASAGGTAVPDVTYTYNPATGLQTEVTAGGASVSTAYDTLGRVTSTTDADGNASTTGYDAAGRVLTVNDGKGTYTYTYDGTDAAGKVERRGLVTSVNTGGAGTFTGAYTADGALAQQNLPGGLAASSSYDNSGMNIALTYAKAGTKWLNFSAVPDADGRIVQMVSAQGSTEEYTYDGAGRLTKVADTWGTQCTTRMYGFDADTNRTSLTAYPADADGLCSTSTTPVSQTYGYDQADRITTSGYTYDAFGRTTQVPAAHVSGSSNVTVGYFSNDMVASLTQGSQSSTFNLDPAGRIRSMTTTGGPRPGTVTNHYASGSDSPSWITEANGTWTRNVTGLGGLGAIQTNGGITTLQLSNLHGDVIATCDSGTGATGIQAYFEQTEYGSARPDATNPTRYSWLGTAQRSFDTLAGFALMGVRLYNPITGRFLQVDPVIGGNANAYEYCGADPINCRDLDGKRSCGWICEGVAWLGGKALGVACAVSGLAFILCNGAMAGLVEVGKYIYMRSDGSQGGIKTGGLLSSFFKGFLLGLVSSAVVSKLVKFLNSKIRTFIYKYLAKYIPLKAWIYIDDFIYNMGQRLYKGAHRPW